MCLSKNLNAATSLAYLPTPSWRMVMRVDHVMEHRLIQLMGVTLSKLGAESETELSVVAACDKSIVLPKPNWPLPCKG
jgi:hypothetical protein